MMDYFDKQHYLTSTREEESLAMKAYSKARLRLTLASFEVSINQIFLHFRKYPTNLHIKGTNLRSRSLAIRYPFPDAVLNYRNSQSGFCRCTVFGSYRTVSSLIFRKYPCMIFLETSGLPCIDGGFQGQTPRYINILTIT